MSKEIGPYDTEIQMFVEKPRPINMSRLIFQRWLVENGKGEHMPFSRPTGDLALGLMIATDKGVLPVGGRGEVGKD